MTIEPETPAEAGVDPQDPDRAHLEGAHVLADQASDRLEARGFTPDEVLAWAEQYLSHEGTGDVEAFLEWIDAREHGRF
jgi:hypothetical protein